MSRRRLTVKSLGGLAITASSSHQRGPGAGSSIQDQNSVRHSDHQHLTCYQAKNPVEHYS
jgi:hypothetical protein